MGLTNDNFYTFREKKTLEERKQISKQYFEKYPDYCIIVCEPHKSLIKLYGNDSYQKKSTYKGSFNMLRYLLSKTDSIQNLVCTLRKSLGFKLKENDSLFLCANNSMLNMSKWVYD